MKILRAVKIGERYEVEVESNEGVQYAWGFGPAPIVQQPVTDPDAEPLPAAPMDEQEWIDVNLTYLKEKVDPPYVEPIPLNVPEEM